MMFFHLEMAKHKGYATKIQWVISSANGPYNLIFELLSKHKTSSFKYTQTSIVMSIM
jgi:hypothetical protein